MAVLVFRFQGPPLSEICGDRVRCPLCSPLRPGPDNFTKRKWSNYKITISLFIILLFFTAKLLISFTYMCNVFYMKNRIVCLSSKTNFFLIIYIVLNKKNILIMFIIIFLLQENMCVSAINIFNFFFINLTKIHSTIHNVQL